MALFAPIDVTVEIAAVAFEILGVHARRQEGGTAIALPIFKDASGHWRPAARLPNEVGAPLTDAVLALLVDKGLAKPKFGQSIA